MSLREARQSVLAPRTELDRGRALFYAGRLTDAQAGLQGVLIDGVIPSPLPIPADTAGMGSSTGPCSAASALANSSGAGGSRSSSVSPSGSPVDVRERRSISVR